MKRVDLNWNQKMSTVIIDGRILPKHLSVIKRVSTGAIHKSYDNPHSIKDVFQFHVIYQYQSQVNG